MLTRREMLAAGGLALAGRLLPIRAPAPEGREGEGPASAVEIAMHASGGGARVWFDPPGVLVRPGTTVRWVVAEGVHTATAYHPANGDRPRRIPQGVPPWDSGYLTAAGDSFEVTLEAEGVHDYFCRPHEAAGMVGRVVVSRPGRGPGPGPPSIRAPDPDGRLPGPALAGFPAVEEILRRGRVPAATADRP